MKKQALLLLFTLCSLSAFSQIAFTAATPFCTGAPTGAPSASGSRFRIDLLTGKQYAWSPTAVSWLAYGQGFDVITGCVAPAYTPGIGQSNFAINSCVSPDVPKQYHYNGTTWDCLNCFSGATYTAGTGIAIDGSNVISNTGDLSTTNELITNFEVTGGSLVVSDAGGGHNVPVDNIAPVQAVSAGTGISISGTSTRTITNSAPDQTVSITGAGINAVTGTYPNFTVTGTEVDGSTTNEIQNLSLTGQALSISGGTGVTLPLIGVGAGTGISVSTAAGSATVTNTAPFSDEAAQDAVGAMAGQTLTYVDATPLLDVKTQMSVTSDASGVKLSGDATSPGNSQLYGTSTSGTKGWISKVIENNSATDYLLTLTNSLAVGTSTANSKLDITTNSLGVTQTNTSGVVLSNNTAAAAGAQQISPALRFRGQGWKTTATAASQTVDFRASLLPVQGASAPTGILVFERSINGGSYAECLKIGSDGSINVGNQPSLGNQFEVRGGSAGIICDRFGDEPYINLLINGTSSGQIRAISGGGLKFTAATAATIWARFDASGNLGVNIAPTEKLSVSGNLKLETTGNKIKIATGSNASIGTATLSSGTVTVSTTAVATGSIVMVSYNTISGTPGSISAPVASITNATSFVINSSSSSDNSSVNWWIIN